MRDAVITSLKRATEFFEKNKEDVLLNLGGSQSLHSIELDSTSLAKLFDQNCGIDYVLLNLKTKEMRGVAARVNFWSGTKGHLTIRYKRGSGAKTEYAKRAESIANRNSLYPHVTIQLDSADEQGSRGMSGGIAVNTESLYKYIEANKDKITSTYMRVCKEGNDFLAIPYADIKSFGILCKIFNTNAGGVEKK